MGALTPSKQLGLLIDNHVFIILLQIDSKSLEALKIFISNQGTLKRSNKMTQPIENG